MDRIAVLADIHGNLPALEAVLADLQRRGMPDAVWVLGDLTAFFPWVHETIDCLRSQPGVFCLQGNTDRYLATGQRHEIPVRSAQEWSRISQTLRLRDESFRWMTGQLTYVDWCYLRDLPRQLGVEIPGYGRVVGVHGVPGDDETGIWPETPDDRIRDYLADVDARMLLTGHTHVPLDRCIEPGRVRVVNPGSVGFHAADWWTACYTLLEFHRDGCRVKRHQAAYDGEKILEKLEASRYPGAAGLLKKLQSGLSEAIERETLQE